MRFKAAQGRNWLEKRNIANNYSKLSLVNVVSNLTQSRTTLKKVKEDLYDGLGLSSVSFDVADKLRQLTLVNDSEIKAEAFYWQAIANLIHPNFSQTDLKDNFDSEKAHLLLLKEKSGLGYLISP